MGEKNIGKIPWIKGRTKETEPKIMEYAINNLGEKNHMFGKHLSEETIETIREIKKYQSKLS